MTSVIQEFALNYAFDQKEVQSQIDYCREELADIQQELEEQYGIVLSMESSAGLLRKGKEVHTFDTSEARIYSVGPTRNLVKLVLLQSNMSVSESERGDSRWVYVQKDELDRVIKEGQGELYGFVNQNTNLCRLKFDLDASNNLVIRDIANRAVLVSLVTKDGLNEEHYQKWAEKCDSAFSKLTDAEHHLRKVRSDFHGALPHNFIDPELPRMMEATIQQVSHTLESVKSESEKTMFRIKHLNEYFS